MRWIIDHDYPHFKNSSLVFAVATAMNLQQSNANEYHAFSVQSAYFDARI